MTDIKLLILLAFVAKFARPSFVQDPTRWIPSVNKSVMSSPPDQTSYSSSYANDGDYYNPDAPMNFFLSTPPNEGDVAWWQIDFVQSIKVMYIQIVVAPGAGKGIKISGIGIHVGESDAARNNPKCVSNMVDKMRAFECFKRGRYLTLLTESALFLQEVAVHNLPTQNLAFRKSVDSSGVYKLQIEANLVDMNLGNYWRSTNQLPNWAKVDLMAIHLVVEIIIVLRTSCCLDLPNRGNGLHVRIGNIVEDGGTGNPLCTIVSLQVGQMKSVLCHMFGQFVTIEQNIVSEAVNIDEVIINPETTENIALFEVFVANVQRLEGYGYPRAIADGFYTSCYVPKPELKNKKIWVDLVDTYNIAMVYIVNHEEFLDQFSNFTITVDDVLCLSSQQDMDNSFSKSFFCDERRTGSVLAIEQQRNDKQMSVCEIAVFEETKPEIQDIGEGQYIWFEEGDDVTLTCRAKGYPLPVVTWIKDDQVIESNIETLVLVNLKKNQSGRYECWANNTNGVDAKPFYLSLYDKLSICAKYSTASDITRNVFYGDKWYRFYDGKSSNELQLGTSPPGTSSICSAWLHGTHPNIQDGVVTRQLCFKVGENDCSQRVNIHVRRCQGFLIYAFRTSVYRRLCLTNLQDIPGDFQPAIASPFKKHALSEKVFYTAEHIANAYTCLSMCQLETACKSFNFSKKLGICQLNNGTGREFPSKLGMSQDYDYYEVTRGTRAHPNAEL